MTKHGTNNPRLIYKRHSSHRGMVYRVGKNGTCILEGEFTSEAELEDIRKKIRMTPTTLGTNLEQLRNLVNFKPIKIQVEEDLQLDQDSNDENCDIDLFHPIDIPSEVEPFPDFNLPNEIQLYADLMEFPLSFDI